MPAPSPDPRLVISYLALRQALGYLGLALPVLLLTYAGLMPRGMQPTISHFYHTGMGDVLVGILCAIGVFLFAYKGYAPTSVEAASSRLRDKIQDKHVARLAGLGAIGVALFPIDPELSSTCLKAVSQHQIDPKTCIQSGATFHPNLLHTISAFVFFGATAIFCFVLFPRGAGTQANLVQKGDHTVARIAPTPRNRYFLICGWVITFAIVALVFDFALHRAGATRVTDLMGKWRYFSWWEVVAVLAFSAAWLEKGRAIASPLQLKLWVSGPSRKD